MTTCSQHRLQVYTVPEGAAARDGGDRSPTSGVGARCDAGAMISDFAVGFSRQPLPKGNRFAIVTNAGGSSIMATDAATCHGLELARLRPETLEFFKAKLPPTATFSRSVDVILDAADVFASISTAEEARAGFERITNGVKQKLPSARLPGVENRAKFEPPVVLADPASTS